jgi:hypothetical protein
MAEPPPETWQTLALAFTYPDAERRGLLWEGITILLIGALMAGRSSFTKRQKERARQERQAEKARKKAAKRSQKDEPSVPTDPRGPVLTYDDEGQPEGLGFHDF